MPVDMNLLVFNRANGNFVHVDSSRSDSYVAAFNFKTYPVDYNPVFTHDAIAPLLINPTLGKSSVCFLPWKKGNISAHIPVVLYTLPKLGENSDRLF
jgi:hypothetical protein